MEQPVLNRTGRVGNVPTLQSTVSTIHEAQILGALMSSIESVSYIHHGTLLICTVVTYYNEYNMKIWELEYDFCITVGLVALMFVPGKNDPKLKGNFLQIDKIWQRDLHFHLDVTFSTVWTWYQTILITWCQWYHVFCIRGLMGTGVLWFREGEAGNFKTSRWLSS